MEILAGPLGREGETESQERVGESPKVTFGHRHRIRTQGSRSWSQPVVVGTVRSTFINFQKERGEGREKERERHMCERNIAWLPLTHPQPKHVPRLGIEPATFWFTGWRSIH